LAKSISQLRSAYENVENAHRELSQALDLAARDLATGDRISVDIPALVSLWNSTLSELVIDIHGEERYGLNLGELKVALDDLQAQHQAATSRQAALVQKAALLEEYGAQKNSQLYIQDTDYRIFLDKKIAELEKELSELDFRKGDPKQAASRTESHEAKQSTEHAALSTSPTQPASSETQTPLSQEAEDRTSPQLEPAPVDTSSATLAETYSEEPQQSPTEIESEELPPTFGDDRQQTQSVGTRTADDDKADHAAHDGQIGSKGTLESEIERGLARLIMRDQWAASCAIAAVTDLDQDTSHALSFCAEAFSLPIISTDPREMLGRNVGNVSQGLQVGGTASALTAVGLDPFVGFLHTDRAGRESLALDLMEEFRPWVERIALTLVNRGELKPAHFVVRDGGAVELTEPARKLLVAGYQQRKTEEIAHPLFREKVRYAQLVFIQARLLARALRDGTAYEPHLFT